MHSIPDVDCSSRPWSRVREPDPSRPPALRRWMSGECRFGDRCNFAHGKFSTHACTHPSWGSQCPCTCAQQRDTSGTCSDLHGRASPAATHLAGENEMRALPDGGRGGGGGFRGGGGGGGRGYGGGRGVSDGAGRGEDERMRMGHVSRSAGCAPDPHARRSKPPTRHGVACPAGSIGVAVEPLGGWRGGGGGGGETTHHPRLTPSPPAHMT
jgi:hypothetical protein